MDEEKVYLYLFDDTGKYVGKEEAVLDTWQTEIKGSPSYKCKENATFAVPEFKEGYTPYYKSGEWEMVANPGLAELKEGKSEEAKIVFAKKRDAIRFIEVGEGKTYGFDTESEDITNFMAAWKAADISGATMYKVWLSETEKGIVTLSSNDFTTVFKAVRDSQFEAYAWLQNKLVEIENCVNKEDLDKVVITEVNTDAKN